MLTVSGGLSELDDIRGDARGDPDGRRAGVAHGNREVPGSVRHLPHEVRAEQSCFKHRRLMSRARCNAGLLASSLFLCILRLNAAWSCSACARAVQRERERLQDTDPDGRRQERREPVRDGDEHACEWQGWEYVFRVP